MKKILFINSLIIICAISTAVLAAPPISEYADVKEGLLLDNKINSETSSQQNTFQTIENQSHRSFLSMDQITNEYKQGNYLNIVNDVKIKAEEGVPEAQELLGIMNRNGQGMEKNLQEAAVWLTKASSADRPEALHQLGMMYFEGQGIEQSTEISLKWLKIATLLLGADNSTDADATQITEDYKKVLISANRRQKTLAAEGVKEWLKAKNKMHLLKKE